MRGLINKKTSKERRKWVRLFIHFLKDYGVYSLYRHVSRLSDDYDDYNYFNMPRIFGHRQSINEIDVTEFIESRRGFFNSYQDYLSINQMWLLTILEHKYMFSKQILTRAKVKYNCLSRQAMSFHTTDDGVTHVTYDRV